MSHIRIGKGMFAVSWERALAESKAGDTFVVTPGEYEIDSITLTNVQVVGSTDPGRTVLRGAVYVNGPVSIRGVTLAAHPYKNALNIKQAQGQAQLDNVVLEGDPAGKYPAIYLARGVLDLTGCTVVQETRMIGVFVEAGGRLNAVATMLGGVDISGSRAQLTDCTTKVLHVSKGGRVSSREALTLVSSEGTDAMQLSGEAAVTAERVVIGDGVTAVANEASFLGIDSVIGPEGSSLFVLAEDAGRVTTSDSHVRVVRSEDIPVESKIVDDVEGDGAISAVPAAVTIAETCEADVVEVPSSRPEEVFARAIAWQPGTSWFTHVAPHLRTGDVVLMDEGDYYLDDYDNSTVSLRDVTLVGRAGVANVRLHGMLACAADASLGVANLCIAAPTDQHAVLARRGSHVRLADVLLIRDDPSPKPLLSLDGSAATLRGAVVGSGVAEMGCDVMVTGAGRLDARDCELGMVLLDGGAQAVVEASAVEHVCVRGGAVFSASGTLELNPLRRALCALWVSQGGAAQVDTLLCRHDYVELLCEGAKLHVGDVEAPEGGSVMWRGDEEADVQVPESVKRIMPPRPEDSTDVDADVDADADVPVPSDGPANEMGPSVEESAEVPSAQTSDATGDVVEADVHEAPVLNSTAELAVVDGVPDEETSVEEVNDASPRISSPSAAGALEEIRQLIGLESVKADVERFVRRASFDEIRRQRGFKVDGRTLHSVFLGNPGTGKTTVARLLGRALHEAGVIRTAALVEVGRKDLVGQTIGASAHMTVTVVDRALGGVLFIDEAYSLFQRNNNEFAQEAVDTLIAMMENHRADLMVVLAGYESQMQDFMQMNPGLASRVPNTFYFADYSAAEIARIGYSALVASDYTVDEAAYERVVTQQYRASADGGNGRWVRNFNERLIDAVAERVVGAAIEADADPSLIVSADLDAVVGGDQEAKAAAVTRLLAELDAMVGLLPVKRWVSDLVMEVQANEALFQAGAQVSRPTYHMAFTGSPGTGKTSVARIVAELFYNLGILAKPVVKVVDKAQMVGAYIGHTEKQVTKLVDSVLGGVLFVDEAYQLMPTEGSRNDFGRIAIETLVPRLDDDRDKFVAIFAGYTQDMERFFDTNPGLRSRVPRQIEFPDYTDEEVAEIVVRRLAPWNIDVEFVACAAAAAYREAPSALRSNGRWARTFADRVEQHHKRATVMNPGVDPLTITNAVVEAVAQELRGAQG